MKPGSFKLALAVIGLLLTAARCAHVKQDTAMAAIEANDATVIIEGCGNQPVVGYTYCRKMEGGSTDELISLMGPPSDCLGEGSCVSFKIFYPDGQPAQGYEIPRGQTRVSLKWKDLTKKETFDKGDVGFWGIIKEVKWLDLEGKEHTTKDIGEIRLRVLAKGYTPLQEVSADPNFVWSWVDSGFEFKSTTGGRSYVGRAPQVRLQ